MQLLVSLMLSRYTCTLEEDRKLQQQQQGKLAPRLAAALVARMAEKEVLVELQQVSLLMLAARSDGNRLLHLH